VVELAGIGASIFRANFDCRFMGPWRRALNALSVWGCSKRAAKLSAVPLWTVLLAAWIVVIGGLIASATVSPIEMQPGPAN
jgi:hypothetical protein